MQALQNDTVLPDLGCGCVSGWLWLGCVRDHTAVDHVGVTHRHPRPSRPLELAKASTGDSPWPGLSAYWRSGWSSEASTTLTVSSSVTRDDVANTSTTPQRKRTDGGQFSVRSQPTVCMMWTCMHACRRRSNFSQSVHGHKDGNKRARAASRPLTGILGVAPNGEEADAGNEDGGAADRERHNKRQPGLACMSSRP